MMKSPAYLFYHLIFKHDRATPGFVIWGDFAASRPLNLAVPFKARKSADQILYIASAIVDLDEILAAVENQDLRPSDLCNSTALVRSGSPQ